MTDEERKERLERFIHEASGSRAVVVRDLRRMAGGASREIWSLDAELEGRSGKQTLPLVLRIDPPGHQAQSSRREEFEILSVAREAGVQVPKVYWLGENPNILGAAFIRMERVEGETLARRLLRDQRYAKARQVLCRELGEALARIHAIEVRASSSMRSRISLNRTRFPSSTGRGSITPEWRRT